MDLKIIEDYNLINQLYSKIYTQETHLRLLSRQRSLYLPLKSSRFMTPQEIRERERRLRCQQTP